ncbi:MAG: chemotaxis protein CheB, partial [Verrucomicrobiota bacterium]
MTIPVKKQNRKKNFKAGTTDAKKLIVVKSVRTSLPARQEASSLPLVGKKSPLPFPIVGIGASAGGLEAFTQLLQNLPVDTGMGFVLIQHLDPGHQSALTQLLRKTTLMQVCEVSSGMKVAPNLVYVIPPNTCMFIERGILKLQPRDKTPGAHRSIDFFFESLAQDQRGRAIGVVLSGTATDGTQGLEMIKSEGGFTFAQDSSAKFDSMPRSAAAAGCVDLVLSPKQIAKELAQIAKHPLVAGRRTSPASSAREAQMAELVEDKSAPLSSAHDNVFKNILALLRTHRGIDFSLYKSNTIHRRITRRMVLNKMTALRDYARFLKGNAKELGLLYSDILINVTSFFRNPEAFETLKQKIFPKLLQGRKPDEPVRVWSLGSSTGQEAYSIAMAYTEFCAKIPSAPRLQIFATDANEALLDKARHALYARNLVADVSPERLGRFFVEEQGGYRVSKSLRDLCVFARQNVLIDPPFSRMDLITCRNMLIYIEPDLQKKILTNFHYGLKPGGFLFLGTSESIGAFTNLFEPLDKKQKIFSKKTSGFPSHHQPVTGRRRGEGSRSSPEKKQRLVTSSPASDGFRAEPTALREADRLMASQFAPPGVLINAELEVLQFRGSTNAYLEPAAGKASFNVLKMARDGLMLPLRAAINQAKKANHPVIRKNARMDGNGGAVNIEVIPLKNLKEISYLILFKEMDVAQTSRSAVAGVSKPGARGKNERLRSGQSSADLEIGDPTGLETRAAKTTAAERRRVMELERELTETRDYAQSLQEQHEAASEELQSSNEEIQSANEELQSTNEELETSKEELESTNEELTTVNEEMASRNTELNRFNNDLTNLHVSINTAILLLERDLTIRRFTPLAEKTFNLLPTDVGRPLSGVRHNLDFPGLEKFITEVIDTVSVREREVQDKNGRWFVLRARPYVTFDKKIDGAVVMLMDINELKLKEQEAKESLDYAQAIVESVPPLLILDPDLRVTTANHSFYQQFKLTPQQTVNRLIFELGKGQWNIPELRKLLKDILPLNSFFDDFQMTYDFGARGRHTLLLSARRLDNNQRILLSTNDITDRLHLEASVRRSEMRFRRLFEAAQDGILILDPETRKIVDANPFIIEFLGYP